MKHPSHFEFAFMNTTNKELTPRKSTVQARSAATVAALHTATIQVLTREGLSRCTTTRIALRAGMSVGSLYQYYPNRDELLASVLEQHLNAVATAVEDACMACEGTSVNLMAEELVSAFLAAKLHNPDESKALYSVAGERNGARLVVALSKRMNAAVTKMLSSASDAQFDDPELMAGIALGALVGPVRAVLEGLTSPAFSVGLAEHLTLLLQGYFKNCMKT